MNTEYERKKRRVDEAAGHLASTLKNRDKPVVAATIHQARQDLVEAVRDHAGVGRLDAEQMAKALSDFVNGATSTDIAMLAKHMADDHRTLQQVKMRLVIAFINLMAKQPTDSRNEAAVKFAKAVVETVPEDVKAMPLI